jgi:hypothetical protein
MYIARPVNIKSQKILEVSIKSIETESQMVFGEVYAPDLVDTDWEAMSREDVEKMAHQFVRDGYLDRIDIQHDKQPCGAQVLESFIARNPNDPFFTEGSWVLGVWIPDDTWNQVKNGELNGFSFYGTSEKQPVKVLIDVAYSAVGETEDGGNDEKGIEKHKHTFVVRFNEHGLVVSGHTDFKDGHSHEIRMTTATEEAFDHAHRYFVE